MYDLTLQTMLFQGLSLLIIAAVNGFVVSLVSKALGDPGPAYDGRLTLNPFPAVDILGALGALVFALGWIKPVVLTPKDLQPRGWGAAAIVLAGSLAVAILAVLVSLLLPVVALTFPSTGAPLGQDFIAKFVHAALGFALVNLIPLPPLAGGYLLDALWPAGAAFLRKYAIIVGIVLLGLLATGYPTLIADFIIAPAVSSLMHT
ncbi:MAG TPA: hypothetical protein VL418_18290 [Devosiaceae bacterium]|jgi:Zn-dependent protease|nr:hypothetical protein [Devosiaceae bacterium]